MTTRASPTARENAAGINTLTDSVRAEVRAVESDSACTKALQRWTALFREHDRHLQLWQFRPRAAPAQATPSRTSGAPADDPRRPTVRFVDDSTAVLRFPTFNMFYKEAIDSLIAAHRARLLAMPYLVVDLRSNDGGADAAYASVIPLFYTDPFDVEGMDLWATEGNITYIKTLIDTAKVPESLKAQGRLMVQRVEGRRGFVNWDEDRKVRLDTVHAMPRRVAVLIAGMCASSCEQFVLDARQSRKVTVLGRQNTAGMLDYGNTRKAILPSGIRQISMPMSRSRRLPARPRDYSGIAPEVLIPKEESDALAFAIRYIKSAGSPKQ